jgi:hypothetical protein
MNVLARVLSGSEQKANGGLTALMPENAIRWRGDGLTTSRVYSISYS